MAEVLIKHLVKRFGKVEAVRDVSLRVADGEFLVLLGPSGCGKSTILRVVAGLEDADAGEIVIGERLVNFVDPVKRNVAMVFQNYALYPHMTVAKNIAFPLQIAKKPKAEIEAAVRRAAGILGLDDLLERLPGQLSGGQRQRVALARAIVREPHAFLMDEPLSNLDAQLRIQTRLELIQLHAQLGITTMYVTHDQVEAMTMGHRIAVMNHGVLQQIGTPQDVYRRPANVFVATFLGAPPMNMIDGALESVGGGWRFRGVDADVPLSPEVLSPPELRHEIEARGEVKLGLRPEHIRVGPPGHDGGIPGRVEFIEPVGSDIYLTVEAGGTTVQVRTDPDSPLRPGDNVTLMFDPWRVHVFGADGHNLRRDAPAVGSTLVQAAAAG
ncbi:MAG TPA: ABC transporter ATP-binding protein [Planctomycetota bacterium]|jgi:multiple sugar transport system ATP-binding protein|nr:ABC transporter ATP-binding protein [Gaiellaceae bacterium]HZV00171.1 ABC transporter ATP-binding protein [Planctomycetota bacterium]